MRSVEKTAETREKAIESALAELGVTLDEAQVEILETGTRGIFGFMARPWKVRVSTDKPEKRRSAAHPVPSHQHETARGGNVPVRRETRPHRPEPPHREERRKETPEKKVATQPKNMPKHAKAEHTTAPPRAPKTGPEETRKLGATSPPSAPKPQHEDAAMAPVTDEQGREAAALLQELVSKMGIRAKAEFVRAEDGSARVNLESEDSALLIGTKGQTLQALQYILNRIFAQKETADAEGMERITVDVEGYVDRRRAALEEAAQRAARQAVRNGEPVQLRPMSAQERRIIHLTLQNHPEVTTHSVGEGYLRSVVVTPKNPRRRPQQKPYSHSGGRGHGRGHRPSHSRRNDQELDPGQLSD